PSHLGRPQSLRRRRERHADPGVGEPGPRDHGPGRPVRPADEGEAHIPTLSNPRDLFLQLLGEMLWTERTLAFEALPALRRDVTAERLAAAVDAHLEQ